MSHEIEPSTYNPWIENKDQTPEAKLVIVRQAARHLVALLDELRQPLNNSSRHDLYQKATEYLNYLEEEETMEFINEKYPWEQKRENERTRRNKGTGT